MAEEVDHGGYGQYCPISRAVEVLGDRWTILIVRDLLCGFTRFNELARGLPGLSRSLLSKRLRNLERAGVVARDGQAYVLTTAGEELREIVFGLGRWGARWQFGDPREHELDPELLMWWVHRRIDFAQWASERVVLAFRFTDDRRRFWVVRDAQGTSICTADPGFDVHAHVEAALAVLYEVWLGRRDLAHALRAGELRMSGTPADVRRTREALSLSPVAAIVGEER
jgi:DNA-binding HxlR family transcriptional regulator